MGSGLGDWIYWHLFVQSLVITIKYNNSQSIFSRTLLPWLPRTRSILVLVLRMTAQIKVKITVTLRLTVGQSVSLCVMTRYLLRFGSYSLVFMGRPVWREDGSVFCICCWPLPAQSFFGPSPLGLATIFYCLRFETSPSVASYDSQGHGGGIRPRLHTGFSFGIPRYIASERIPRKTPSLSNS
jgi:hypothetical protein